MRLSLYVSSAVLCALIGLLIGRATKTCSLEERIRESKGMADVQLLEIAAASQNNPDKIIRLARPAVLGVALFLADCRKNSAGNDRNLAETAFLQLMDKIESQPEIFSPPALVSAEPKAVAEEINRYVKTPNRPAHWDSGDFASIFAQLKTYADICRAESTPTRN